MLGRGDLLWILLQGNKKKSTGLRRGLFCPQNSEHGLPTIPTIIDLVSPTRALRRREPPGHAKPQCEPRQYLASKTAPLKSFAIQNSSHGGGGGGRAGRQENRASCVFNVLSLK